MLRNVADFSSDYLNQLGTDVLELVLKLDGLGNGDAILRDLGAAPTLLDDHVTALRQVKRLVRPSVVDGNAASCFNCDQITSSTRFFFFSDRDNKDSSFRRSDNAQNSWGTLNSWRTK